MIFTGGGDYKAQGEKFVKLFCELGGLKPSDHALDIGSGMGRMAVPLMDFLDETGRYDGIDIVKQGINWCKKHISKKDSRFHFHHSDIYNDLYNSSGKVKGSEYRFPFEDNTFHFAFLTSVFTHMLKDEVEHYLCEISRTLQPGGTCFATCFILNEESLSKMSPKGIHFPVDKGDYRVMNAKVETANVGYYEDQLHAMARNAGLEITSVHYGKWCNRENYLDFQDIVILKKPHA